MERFERRTTRHFTWVGHSNSTLLHLFLELYVGSCVSCHIYKRRHEASKVKTCESNKRPFFFFFFFTNVTLGRDVRVRSTTHVQDVLTRDFRWVWDPTRTYYRREDRVRVYPSALPCSRTLLIYSHFLRPPPTASVLSQHFLSCKSHVLLVTIFIWRVLLYILMLPYRLSKRSIILA